MRKLKKIYTFLVFNAVISIVWWITEALTLGQLQESWVDTYIALALSLLLTMIFYSKPVVHFLRKEN